MKVSIDGILNSARKMYSQVQIEEENLSKKKKEVKTDSISIGSKITSRLENIENEFREIQSSLTKNQIINDGLERLKNDYSKGGQNVQNIFNEVKFEGSYVLKSYVGDTVNDNVITEKLEKNKDFITIDVEKLKRLYIELDNMMASNIAGEEKIGNIMTNIDSAFSKVDVQNIENISRLRADSVMRLIK